VLKALKSSHKKFQRRRNFLSRTAAVGGMAIVGASVSPAQAAKLLTRDSADASPQNTQGASPENQAIWPGNATVKDFSRLMGKRFRLRTEDGTTSYAKLIEANSPRTRRALRFRREHYSIVFDVPDSVELVQGQYRISHPQIGSMDLFMVPVDLPEKYNRLEAVFT